MGGDFNLHREKWYGSLTPEYTGVIRAIASPTTYLVNWAGKHDFTIQNIPGTLTHTRQTGTAQAAQTLP